MKDCVFCRRLKLHQDVKSMPGYDGCHQVLRVALVDHLYRKDARPYLDPGARTTDYNSQGYGFALNYCPVCGRRIKK